MLSTAKHLIRDSSVFRLGVTTLFSITLFWVGGCKTEAPQHQLHDVNDDDESARIDGKVGEEVFINTFPVSVWRDFEEGKYKVSWRAYQDLWQRYQFLTKVGESQFKIKSFQAHFYIKAEKAQPASSQGTTPPPPAIEVTDKLSRVCPTELKQGRKILTYQLMTERQPNLVRNFLVLAKLGYYDGQPINFYPNVRFDDNKAAMVYFGLNPDEPGPFFVRPDRRYTSPSAAIDLNRYKPPAPGDDDDIRDTTGVPLDVVKHLFETNTTYGSLVGLTENLTDLDQSRRIFGMRIGMPLLKSAIEDYLAGYAQAKTYPVAFGRLAQKKNPRLNLPEMLEEMMSDADPKSVFRIDCVEIPEPTLMPYEKPAPDFPFANDPPPKQPAAGAQPESGQ